MKILVVEPEKKPYAREISDDIHEMQEVVDGLIEPILILSIILDTILKFFES